MRVVLVDSSRTVLKFVRRLLEVRGHDVRAFTDGRLALDYMRAEPSVGALITSAEPRALSGLELCWETRLLSKCSRPIYVILMSSNRNRHELSEALDCGADDYICKPPVAEELYARLRAAERLTAMQQELMRLATTDPLTGVLNRRAFFERAHEAWPQARADGRFSAIVFDIDHFKRVNDTHGHDVGDKALCAVARLATAESEIIGRLGGEEFAMLLDSAGLAEARKCAERLRRKVMALRIDTDRSPVTLTCSLGVSAWRPGDNIDLLLKRADVALYAAKTNGRDRVVVVDSNQVIPEGTSVTSFVRNRARG